MGYTYSLWHGVQEHKLFAKRIFAGVMAVLFAGSIAAAMSASAYAFSSTNDDNREAGYPHVKLASETEDSVTLDFVNDTNSYAYFEYRVDGEVVNTDTPHQIVVDDYEYPGVEVDSRGTAEADVVSRTFEADETVEVRFALGGESDWFFDWTTFNVAPDETVPEVPTVLGFYKDYNKDSTIVPCGGYTNNTNILIDWEDVEDAEYYWFGTKNNEEHKKVTVSEYRGSMTASAGPDFYYTVKAVDTAGNVSDVSAQCALTLDTEAPIATITEPREDGAVLSDVATVTGTVDAAEENIKSHWFEVKDEDGDASYFYEMNTDELSWSFDWDTTTVDDGTYTIRYVATDKAGNRSDVTGDVIRTVEVDNRADTKEECKNGGWALGLSLDQTFRNQGDCVSHFSSETQETRNPDAVRGQNARR